MQTLYEKDTEDHDTRPLHIQTISTILFRKHLYTLTCGPCHLVKVSNVDYTFDIFRIKGNINGLQLPWRD